MSSCQCLPFIGFKQESDIFQFVKRWQPYTISISFKPLTHNVVLPKFWNKQAGRNLKHQNIAEMSSILWLLLPINDICVIILHCHYFGEFLFTLNVQLFTKLYNLLHQDSPIFHQHVEFFSTEMFKFPTKISHFCIQCEICPQTLSSLLSVRNE